MEGGQDSIELGDQNDDIHCEGGKQKKRKRRRYDWDDDTEFNKSEFLDSMEKLEKKQRIEEKH